MTRTKNRADIAHAIVLEASGWLADEWIDSYLSFPCHLCGKPMDTESGECHAKCVAEEPLRKYVEYLAYRISRLETFIAATVGAKSPQPLPTFDEWQTQEERKVSSHE